MRKTFLNFRTFPFHRESTRPEWLPPVGDGLHSAASRTFSNRMRTLSLILLLLMLAGGRGNSPAAASVAEGSPAIRVPPSPTANHTAVHADRWPAHWIGVEVEGIPPVFSSLLGLQPNQGLLVIGVVPSSPAGHAGLKPGDLLYKLNGHPLLLPSQLIQAANAHYGSKAALCNLEIIRKGKRAALAITPLPRPALAAAEPAGGLPGAGATPETTPRSAGPASTGRMVPGPGILVRLQGNAVQGEALPRFFSVSRWTQKNGQMQTMQISTGGKIYAVDMAHLDKLPPQIAMLARIFSRMHQIALPPQAASGQSLQKTTLMTQPVKQLTVVETERLNLVRQILLIRADVQNLIAVRNELAVMNAPLRSSRAMAAKVPESGPDRAFECKMIDAQIAGLTAQKACLMKDLAKLPVKNPATNKK